MTSGSCPVTRPKFGLRYNYASSKKGVLDKSVVWHTVVGDRIAESPGSRMAEQAHRPAADIDPLLLPFLSAEGEAEGLLSRLVFETADPIIHGVLRQKLHVSLRPSDGSAQNQDALDLAQSIRALLISELRNLKANMGQRVIGDFRQYVAVKAYSACADYFRQKHPRRWRLKNALRYQLKQNRRFTLWEDEKGIWACGLRAWEDSPPAQPARSVRQSADARLLFPEGSSLLQQLPLSELLEKVLERAGGPLALDQVVAIVADAKGIQDRPVESYNQDKVLNESLASPAPAADSVLEQQLYLGMLWEEVCDLPALQRSALLLNLRDRNSDSVIAFLPYLGIASKNEIAELVGVGEDRFAQLWNDLPLEDSAIAQLLGITRQQVINLRKTARERLARRMQAREKNSSRAAGQR